MINATGFESGICKLQIKNVTSQEISRYKFNCSDKYFWIDVSTFSPGIYTIDITVDDKNIISEKLVILR